MMSPSRMHAQSSVRLARHGVCTLEQHAITPVVSKASTCSHEAWVFWLLQLESVPARIQPATSPGNFPVTDQTAVAREREVKRAGIHPTDVTRPWLSPRAGIPENCFCHEVRTFTVASRYRTPRSRVVGTQESRWARLPSSRALQDHRLSR